MPWCCARCACSRWRASCSSRCSTGSRSTATSTRRAVLQRREAEVSRLQAQQKQLQTRIATVGSGRRARARGAAARAREAGGAALHRPRDRCLAPALTTGAPGSSTSARWTISPSSSASSGGAPRAFRRVAVRCPFGKPAVAEQAPFDRDGTPFPTQFWLTCRHLVAAIARLEAGGRGRALEQGRRRRPRAAAQPRARAGGAAGAAAGAAARDRRRDAGRQPEVPARPRRVRARPSRLRARRADPRRGRAALAGGRVLLGSMIGASMESSSHARNGRPAAPRRTRRGRSRRVRTAAARDRDRDRRPAPPDRAHVHAAGARRRLRRAPTPGSSTRWTTSSSTTCRPRPPPSPAPPSPSMHAAPPTTSRERVPAQPAAAEAAPAVAEGAGRRRRRGGVPRRDRTGAGARRQFAAGRHTDARAHPRPTPARPGARNDGTTVDESDFKPIKGFSNRSALGSLGRERASRSQTRPAPAGEPDWLTLGQAAKFLGVAQSTIRKWSDQGRVPAFYTPGGHRRYRRRDLEAFIDRSGPGRQGRGPLVLVVDDDARVREFMRINLELEGYSVREADERRGGAARDRGPGARPRPARRRHAGRRRLAAPAAARRSATGRSR